MQHIRIADLAKSFGPTRALRSVSIDLEAGTVHAILGENGSGKSTLIKTLAGVVAPDAGSIAIDGIEARLTSPRVAHALGIHTVFQEILTAPNRSLVDNVHLGFHPWWRRRTSPAEQARRTRELFASLGIPDVDVTAEAGEVPLYVQQVTVIARALLREPRLLILDEATAALGLSERRALFDVIRGLRQAGVVVVFVSHRLDEVVDISDTVTVLRSGRVVGQVDAAGASAAVLLGLMAPEAA
ncbi:MAG: ATP-binding cassette domain-containing protein [Chloroflexota bacterium]